MSDQVDFKKRSEVFVKKRLKTFESKARCNEIPGKIHTQVSSWSAVHAEGICAIFPQTVRVIEDQPVSTEF
jgi:hypothetical protein